MSIQRGDIWQADMNPTRGHETHGVRPVLVVSDDRFNQSAAGLVVVVPITRTRKGVPLHIGIDPPEGGLSRPSFIKCEEVRAISTERLLRRRGGASASTMSEVEDRLRMLLNLF